jgi:hypothetical protein
MPAFVFSYRTPVGYEPTNESMGQWVSWFEGMGDQLTDMGKPAVEQSVIGNCDTGTTQLGGYSLIVADDLEAATTIAKGCPVLDRNGGVEIGRLGEVPDLRPATA